MAPMPVHLWTYRGRVERVLDGDTYSIELDLGFGIRKAGVDNHFRLAGVSCPEIRGPEREAGIHALSFVVDWLGSPDEWPLIIQTERVRDAESRSFTRWVASVWRVADGANLAEDIIAAGHGIASTR
jgi:endonuclease YncB( thermonuclease family)